MDAPYANGATYYADHRRQFPSLPNLQSQFYQTSQAGPHTLPPLQPQRVAPANANDFFGRSQEPVNPASSSQINDYTSQERPRYPVSSPQYPQALLQYSNNDAYITQPAHTLSYDQNHVPAVSQAQLHDLRPMPSSGILLNSSLSTDYNPAQSFSMPGPTQEQEDPPRTHVVGSQGRRGILPSAAGRPAAVTREGTSTKSSIVPIKDADGKFPCPHCNKTYLHAKHLKRHLLRHTGDRPYSCILCNDTFSRSDILKRHFQKCSIRRGNPTGATHLSNSQSHLKRQGAKKSINGDMDDSDFSSVLHTPMSAPSSSLTNPNSLGLGILGVSESYQTASLPVSRTASVKKNSNGNAVRDKRSMTGPIPPAFKRASINGTPIRPDSTSLPSSTVSTPLQLRRSRHSGQFSQAIAPDQPPLNDIGSLPCPDHRTTFPQVPGTQHLDGNFDWNAFSAESKQEFSDQMLSSSGGHHHSLAIKPEAQEHKFYPLISQQQTDDALNSVFEIPSSNGALANQGFQHWDMHTSQIHPFHAKAERLVSFCRAQDPGRIARNQEENELLRFCLTGENIAHFLSQFSNFQGHWPVIHMPTFNPNDTYDGLVLSMICIGAVYSDQLNISQVRTLLSRAKFAIEESSHIFSFIRGANVDLDYFDTSGSDGFEEMQALVLLEVLSIWHGNQVQRQNARDGFGHYVQLARQLRMLQPTAVSSSHYSLLHHQSPVCDQVTFENWDWFAWVRQEKRSRLMYIIFLADAALVLYFNCQPHLNPLEIKLPLPADDEAWEAGNVHDCANVLGLFGLEAQHKNITGSRRRKQPEMHMAMKALLHPTYDFEMRCTNAYSKFILIHGLHVQIWNVQKQLSQDNAMYGLHELGAFTNGSNTPISQYDWIAMGNKSTRTSNSNSGQATPTDTSGAQSPGMHQMLKATTIALGKWKKIWDEDMPLQYPPEIKRLGFCRDGIHFYWLAHLFLKQSRASDWQTLPDPRFLQVMKLLKQAKSYVASEHAIRGEETGSVGDIDEKYGVADLTSDMRLLFTPLTPDFHSTGTELHPGPGSGLG
ncbi:hypothetical protein MMC13_007220 [Lambiella insularis]|nr:hypothetical protein [Lambiella insularis]